MYPRFNYKNALPTPWGKADSVYKICDRVLEVNTPGHGGILVGKAAARRLLSPKAQAVGFEWAQYIAFEEDCNWAGVVYEEPEIYAAAWVAKNPGIAKEQPDKVTPAAF